MKKRLAKLFNLFILVFGVMIGHMTSSQNQIGIIVEKAKPVEDADGHVYRTVKIGNQIWMAEKRNPLHRMLGAGTWSMMTGMRAGTTSAK